MDNHGLPRFLIGCPLYFTVLFRLFPYGYLPVADIVFRSWPENTVEDGIYRSIFKRNCDPLFHIQGIIPEYETIAIIFFKLRYDLLQRPVHGPDIYAFPPLCENAGREQHKCSQQ